MISQQRGFILDTSDPSYLPIGCIPGIELGTDEKREKLYVMTYRVSSSNVPALKDCDVCGGTGKVAAPPPKEGKPE